MTSFFGQISHSTMIVVPSLHRIWISRSVVHKYSALVQQHNPQYYVTCHAAHMKNPPIKFNNQHECSMFNSILSWTCPLMTGGRPHHHSNITSPQHHCCCLQSTSSEGPSDTSPLPSLLLPTLSCVMPTSSQAFVDKQSYEILVYIAKSRKNWWDGNPGCMQQAWPQCSWRLTWPISRSFI